MLIADAVRVHRLEYPFPVVYLCHVLWGACFAMTDPRQLLAWPVVLAMVANLIPLIAQNPLNSAMDVHNDQMVVGKASIAAATLRLKRSRVIRWAAAEMAVALVLAILTGIPLVIAAVAVGIVVELLYNLEPVRLKRRGWANPVFLGLHFSFLPCIGTFAAVRSDFPGWIWPLFLGLWALLIGRTLWWSLPDRVADARAGDRTVPVRLGARRALSAALAVTTLALVLIGWGVWWHSGPLWSVVAVATSGLFLLGKTRNLTVVMIADVLLVLIPFL